MAMVMLLPLLELEGQMAITLSSLGLKEEGGPWLPLPSP